eukprot:TRINITY_DN3734_c0_g1_i7.p1 TRINITY_DN3734_c0_g1~~TRINITY_DN3734_c0_g1_i7.p1  ORF type:complete len:288 (-),score=32.47 TRINITY_DN3734_c0_g1_i7:142-1005(-)
MCEYMQKGFDCLNKNKGQCFSAYCDQDEFCFYNLQYFPHFRQIDVAFVSLLNVQLSVQTIRAGGLYIYKRLSLLDMSVVDQLLGFKIGTLKEFENCESSIDCLEQRDPLKKINSSRDFSRQQVINNEQKNNIQKDENQKDGNKFSLKSGWGLIVLVVAAPLLLCTFICVSVMVRRHTRQPEVSNAQNVVEIQIPKTTMNVQQIMEQFNYFEYKPSTNNGQQYVDNAENAQNQFDVCAICFDEYAEGQKIALLRCAHMYHKNCLEKWVMTKGERCTCPLCGIKLVEEQ